MAGGPPPMMDDGFGDGYDDMGPEPGPGPGGPRGPGAPIMDYCDDMMGGPPSSGMFGILMLSRKAMSVLAITAVIGLEASIAIQNSRLKPMSSILKAKNSFRKRDLAISAVSGLVTRATKEDKAEKGAAALPKVICGYYSGFDVPAVKAGIARSVIYHFFNCIALLGLLWLERPGPRETSEMLGCSTVTLPPVGNVGLITFSLLQVWLGTSVLNHYISTLAYIAAYVLVVVGFIGLLFGVIFMSKLKSVSPAGGMDPGMMPPDGMYDEQY